MIVDDPDLMGRVLERKGLLRLEPSRLQPQGGIEGRHARRIEAPAMPGGTLAGIGGEGPAWMMGAIDEALKPQALGT